MFISTLYFLLGSGDKDTGVTLGFIDIIAFLAFSFVGGRWLSWAGLLIVILLMLCAMKGAHLYFAWREGERQRRLKIPGWRGFMGSWIPLADMWADLFGGGGMFFIFVLVLGKLSRFLW